MQFIPKQTWKIFVEINIGGRLKKFIYGLN